MSLVLCFLLMATAMADKMNVMPAQALLMRDIWSLAFSSSPFPMLSHFFLFAAVHLCTSSGSAQATYDRVELFIPGVNSNLHWHSLSPGLLLDTKQYYLTGEAQRAGKGCVASQDI